MSIRHFYAQNSQYMLNNREDPLFSGLQANTLIGFTKDK